MSWKQTPHASTAILISRGPGSRGVTSMIRNTSGEPVRSATTARIRSNDLVRRKPVRDDLPLAALGFHDRARQGAGMLVRRERQGGHQAGVVVLHAFERRDNRGFVSLAAGALE